ncbi:MAG: AmmeMemoRadiSam system protein B [Candidatus Aminicenantes bacterium]|nr:AmmeMemoRadiSam system protein B [Candidatus Aminicenantes bacterium]
MNKKTVFFLSLAALTASVLQTQGIRDPVWAGKFYDSRPTILSAQIDAFLDNAANITPPSGEIKAIIVPHAGYTYSGQVAAFAYRLVHGKEIDSVVVLGTSHRYGFKGCSIYSDGGYKTPLGVTEIDRKLAKEIAANSGFDFIPQAHSQEHSIEVQIPFIQKVLPDAKIVPIVVGFPSEKTITSLATALEKSLQDKKALVVVSTDMSHFYSHEKASEIDGKTISLISSFNSDELIKRLENGENIMCGGSGVVASLLYARKTGESKIQVLRYQDSSQSGGPTSEVVGYLSAIIYHPGPAPVFSLEPREKSALVRLAREAVTKYILEKKMISYSPDNPKLLTRCGAFVTLKNRGSLRGCIGFIDPVAPLYQTIIQAAIYAATQDFRFKPVAADEIRSLEFEISVLTPLHKITDPDLVSVGKHGLVIAQNGKKGLLLPQVPIENNWSRKTFLEQACLKAGLPPSAWREGADIFVFEAIVFKE